MTETPLAPSPAAPGSPLAPLLPEEHPRTAAPGTPAQRLQAARETLSWSRPTLATRTGCEASTVFRYETGTRTPPPALVDWLETLAAAWQRLYAALPPPPAGRPISGTASEINPHAI